MPAALSLLVFALCLASAHAILLFSKLHQYSRAQIENDPFIEVFASSSAAIEGLHKEFLVLKVVEREKRSAISRLVQVEDRLQRTLQRYEIIEDEEELVKTRIRPSFSMHNRKWSYSIVFAVIGQEDDVLMCLRELSKLGVERINSHPTINYLNQKIKSMDAFNNAKDMLATSLLKFPNMQIKSVQRIDIFGIKIENSAILQNQIRLQSESELLNQTQLGELQSIEANMQEEGDIGMKVVFKVGHQADQQQAGSAQYGSQYSEDEHSQNSQ